MPRKSQEPPLKSLCISPSLVVPMATALRSSFHTDLWWELTDWAELALQTHQL